MFHQENKECSAMKTGLAILRYHPLINITDSHFYSEEPGGGVFVCFSGVFFGCYCGFFLLQRISRKTI